MAVVSVIIPTYNCGKFISEAIESVLGQTYQDFEIVIVDDGSADNTRDVIASFEEKYPRKIKYIYQKNQGMCIARNIAIKNSHGKFVAFLDADDFWMPTRLEKEISIFEKYREVGLVHSNVKNVDEAGLFLNIPLRKREKLSGYLFKQIFLRETNVNITTIMIRRECLDDVGLFDENLTRLGCEDRELILRISRKYKIHYVDLPLGVHRFRQGSLSKDIERMVKARIYVIDKFFPPGKNEILRRKALGRVYKDLGDDSLFSGRFSEAGYQYLISLKYWPFFYYAWKNFLKSLFHYKAQRISKMKIDLMQIWDCAIRKDSSFGDLAVQIAEEGKKRGLGIHFVVPNFDFEETRLKITGAEARYTVIPENWKKLRNSLKLLFLILKIKPKIADFHFCDTLSFFPVFLFARLAGIEIVYHYHGEIQPLGNLRFVNRHFSRLRFLTVFVNKIICVSEANKRYLKALNIRKHIDVIYNGIQIQKFLENFQRHQRQTQDIFKGGIKIITSIGSLIPRKGVDVLIRAFQQVLKEAPEARLIIVGKGDTAKFERLVQELGMQDYIHLTGFVKEYPYGILNSTDLYVSASYAESFGLSIAEAELRGLCVLATRVGGVPEVVVDKKTGLLVNAGDPQALAEKMIFLLKADQLRKTMGLAGKEHVIKMFSLKERVEELFENLFSEKKQSVAIALEKLKSIPKTFSIYK